MAVVPDTLILVFVGALAGLYTALVYPWLDAGERPEDVTIGSERLGLSILLGTLLLAVANNYLSAAAGSAITAVVLPGVPLCLLVVRSVRRGWRAPFHSLRPTLGRDVAAAAVCLLFLLAIAHKLFFWQSLSTHGLHHPDLPWHVGRVAQQAFHSSPGFWPLSPLAFPAPLPFMSFAADSLASAVFRYLPLPIYAFHYSQVLFSWAIVLWVAVVLVAGSGPWRSLVVLTVAILLLPALVWGIGYVGINVFVYFLANPNSLVAWPVALALTFHLYRSFRRRSPPSLPVLLLLPPASLFIKANQAVVFGFLQLIGFGLLAAHGGVRAALKRSVAFAAVWAAVIGMAAGMGRWPVGTPMRRSLENMRYYASFALPNQDSWPEWRNHVLSFLLIVAALSTAGVLVSRLGRTPRSLASILGRQVAIPMLVLCAALGYVLLGWWQVVPNRVAGGEPMHLNFELIMWIAAVTISGAVCSVYEMDGVTGRLRGARRFIATAVPGLTLVVFGYLAWSLNNQPLQRGGIPLAADYSTAAEARIRAALKPQIPDGHCFAYARRYAVCAEGEYDPDLVIAATGCPVLNGRRWRGYLGNNRPELLTHFHELDVSPGVPYRIVRIGSRRAEGPEHLDPGPVSARAAVISAARRFRRDAGCGSDMARMRALLRAIDPSHREERLLVRMGLGEMDSRKASDAAMREAGVRPLSDDMRGAATLEGVSERTLADGRTELVVYFRPQAPWANRRLWLHAYPPDSHQYVDVYAQPQAFEGWQTGELAWERFELPAAGRFNVYVGVAIDQDLGPAFGLGWVGR